MGTSVVERPAPRHRANRLHPSHALAWSFANTAFAKFGTLAIGIALARLLGPEEFGTFAVALVALMAILSFNELGVSLAIVRWRDDPATIAPTVTTLSVGMSAVLTALTVAGAPAFADAMGDPDAAIVVQLLSLCILINGVVAAPAALLQRAFRQDQRAVADQVNVWVGAFVSIGLAVLGMGAMALVVGRLAGAGLSAILFLHYSPLPYRFGFDLTKARALLAFGLPLAGASVIVFLVGFVDQLVVGSVLGATFLGYYVLAANLANWPVTMFSQPLRMVAPALFARLQDDPQEMRAAFPRVLRPLSAVALPLCVALGIAAPEVITFVYGDQWAPAAPVLQWLALFAAVRIMFELAYDYLVVLGRSNSILGLQVIWILALVPAVWFGIDAGGLEGAAFAIFLVGVAISMPLYLWELSRVGLRVIRLVVAVVPAIFVTIALAGVVHVVVHQVEGTFVPLLVVGLLTATAGLVLLRRSRGDLAVFRTGGAE